MDSVEANERAMVAYLRALASGHYEHHDVVRSIRATSGSARAAGVGTLLEWLRIVRLLCGLNVGHNAPMSIRWHPVTTSAVGRFLRRRTRWVEEVLECVALLGNETESVLAIQQLWVRENDIRGLHDMWRVLQDVNAGRVSAV